MKYNVFGTIISYKYLLRKIHEDNWAHLRGGAEKEDIRMEPRKEFDLSQTLGDRVPIWL